MRQPRARCNRPQLACIRLSSPGAGRRNRQIPGAAMNIHEYQAKELISRYGAPVPRGALALSVAEAVRAAETLPGPVWVAKAQIHAGGRGKGRFKEAAGSTAGGVRL